MWIDNRREKVHFWKAGILTSVTLTEALTLHQRSVIWGNGLKIYTGYVGTLILLFGFSINLKYSKIRQCSKEREHWGYQVI